MGLAVTVVLITVTVILATDVQVEVALSVPLTLYIVVEEGLALTVAPVVELRPGLGVHV